MSTSVKVTRKTTTTESVPRFNAKNYGGGAYTYKSVVTPRRNTFVQRTSAVPAYAVSKSVSIGYGAGIGPAAGSYAAVSGQQVVDVRNSREREKKDMQDLNERFANYIEKVRFLEAQNKKLCDELAKLKDRWGKETASIKIIFTTELEENRKLLEDAEKEKARLEIRCTSLEEQLEENEARLGEYKDRCARQEEEIDKQNQTISNLEAELSLLKKRIDQLEERRIRDKDEINRLTDALNATRADLNAETLARIVAENRCQTLEEEIEFMKEVHEQELKELAALAYRDTTAENREFWKNEMGQALHEIQLIYDEKLDTMRGELDQFYNVKIQEFRTGATRQGLETEHAKEESKRLRSLVTDLRAKLADLEARNAHNEKEIELMRREYEEKERDWEIERTELNTEVAKLRAELEAILKELQELMDTKLGLELEIAAYRKLLEGEENRAGLRQIVDSWVSGGSVETTEDSSMRMSQVVKGEMSAKTTYQRSAKGPISVTDCAADGRFIILENTGRKDENIDGWVIRRQIEGEKQERVFKIEKATLGTTANSKQLKIYAKEAKRDDNDKGQIIETGESSWGYGENIKTKLFNQNNEEKASHVQKTLYSS